MQNEKEIIPYLRLMLNIQYPPLDECWLDGYESGGAEVEDKDNPYPESSAEHEYWLEGWWEGFYQVNTSLAKTNIKRDAKKIQTKPSKVTQQTSSSLSKKHQHRFDRWGKIMRFVKVSGVIAATFIISYQLIDVIR